MSPDRERDDPADPDAADQVEVPCVFMRGGTSKGLFFHEADLPPPGTARDRLLKRAMGTPDSAQIDGMGGSTLNTSKAVVVRKSDRPGIDVDYAFAQVELAVDAVSHDGNCGNLSSAVGPFAIDEGLVPANEPLTTVRMFNTNTDTVLVAQVPVRNGRARTDGACSIAGVPGMGAEILVDYSGTVGSRTGHLLPTGHVVDRVTLEDGRAVAVSVCDVANPCVFVRAADLGLRGDERAAAIEANAAVIALAEEIRTKIGQSLGFWPDWRADDLPAMPMLVIVAAGGDDPSSDLLARLLYLKRCHPTMAGTGAICLAAASRVAGTLVNQAVAPARAAADILRIGHPSGVIDVKVAVSGPSAPSDTAFTQLGFARTARRLMAGTVFVPRSAVAEPDRAAARPHIDSPARPRPLADRVSA